MKTRIALLLFILVLPLALFAQQLRNAGFVLMPTATRTATTVSSSDCCTTDNLWTQIHAVINVSVYTAGSYTPKIQGKNPATGTYYDILVGSAISSAGATVLKVGPGIVPLANGSAQDLLPKTWRMTFSGSATPNMAFSVGINPGE